MEAIITLIREKIEERLSELNEALDEKTGNKQFDNGFNLAVLEELRFLQDLVLVLSLELENKEQ